MLGWWNHEDQLSLVQLITLPVVGDSYQLNTLFTWLPRCPVLLVFPHFLGLFTGLLVFLVICPIFLNILGFWYFLSSLAYIMISLSQRLLARALKMLSPISASALTCASRWLFDNATWSLRELQTEHIPNWTTNSLLQNFPPSVLCAFLNKPRLLRGRNRNKNLYNLVSFTPNI